MDFLKNKAFWLQFGADGADVKIADDMFWTYVLQYVESVLKHSHVLAQQYETIMDGYEPYNVWARILRFVEVKSWDLENIDGWLRDNKSEFFDVFRKYLLTLNRVPLWRQYMKFVKSIVSSPRNLRDYDCYGTLQRRMRSKIWSESNPELRSLFSGIFTESYGNSFSEHLGHQGNMIMPPHRACMSVMMLRALVCLVENGPAMETAASGDLVAAAIDCWQKTGHMSADNMKEIAEKVAVSRTAKYMEMLHEAEDEWKGDFRYSKEAKSKYAKAKGKKLVRQSKLSAILKDIKKVLGVERQRAERKANRN